MRIRRLSGCLFFSFLLLMYAGISWGQPNYAVSFNNYVCSGSADHITVPHDPSLTQFTQLTVECLIKPAESQCQDQEAIIGKGVHDASDGMYLWQGGSQFMPDRFGFEVGAPPNQVELYGQIPSYDEWHHLAGVYDGNWVRLFIDGVMADEAFAPRGQIVNNSSPLDMNHHVWSNGESNRLLCDIDEVRISRCARYSNPFATPCMPFEADSFTVALYHFDEGEGTTVYDASSNSNHGTFVNTPSWIDSDAEFVNCCIDQLPYFEDFASSELDSCWKWIREDDSHWSLTERPGWMRITTQPGDFAGTDQNENLLLRSKAIDRFSIETKLQFDPVENNHAAGLIFYYTDSDYLLLQREYNEGQFLSFKGSDGIDLDASWVNSNTDLHLRLDVSVGHTTARWSTDGENWEFLTSVVVPWFDTAQYSYGVFATNGLCAGVPCGNAEIPADFDFLRVDSLEGNEFCGEISGTWSRNDSPFLITCDVKIPAGDSLIIEPGVQVNILGSYKFTVEGRLRAQGTEEEPITFTTNLTANPNGWRGLWLTDSGNMTLLEHCIIENGITSGHFPYNCGGGIFCEDGMPTIRYCTIQNCTAWDGGAIGCYFADPIIEHCIIRDNRAEDSGGGIYGYRSDCKVSNCAIYDNTATIRGGAMSWFSNSHPEVDYCTIALNSAPTGAGILVYEGSRIDINGTIVYGNSGYGIRADAGSNTIKYSNFYGNLFGSYVGTRLPAGIGVLDTVNTNGDSTDIYFNIGFDPLFEDVDERDFRISSSSPCINAGDPSDPKDPDSTTADIGAFYCPKPIIIANPDDLSFGQIDLGEYADQSFLLYNPSGETIPFAGIEHQSQAFTFDTTGLGSSMPPESDFYVSVRFEPAGTGQFVDTLKFFLDNENQDIVQVAMSGNAIITPKPVDSLVICKGEMNGIELKWAPVTESIAGQSLSTVIYIIYGATEYEADFIPFGFTYDTHYLHPFVTGNQEAYYYFVKASLDMSALDEER